VTLLAIDGPAGAGKTTFAAQLEAELLVNGTVKVIHMDDLYNGWDNALSNPLSEILDRISTAHIAGREFVIKIFNWHIMQFDREEIVTPTDYLIIEGVGAAQQIVREAGATAYWLDIEPEIGLQRVLDRDGAHFEVQMRQWQVDQDKHFARDETRENCEFKLTS
jgi:adenylate kinase family enzyme